LDFISKQMRLSPRRVETALCANHPRTEPEPCPATLWWLLLFICGFTLCSGAEPDKWVLSCEKDNDILLMLSQSGQACVRFESPEAAIQGAPEGSAVLLLADAYPTKTLELRPALFAAARGKKLNLYIEFPGFLPGLSVGKPRTAVWERAVVTSGYFAPALPPLSILSPQNCVFLECTSGPRTHLALGRVAGYDKALFGLPERTFPLLFELPETDKNGRVLIATTKLSQVVTARFGPVPCWQAVWHGILRWLNPNARIQLNWTSTVQPALSRDEELPSSVEQSALKRGVSWFVKSRLLLHPSHTNEVAKALASDGLAPAPRGDAPIGDGSLGILEGYYSRIQPDGSQLQAVSVRGDCNGESAMALAFGGRVFRDAADSAIARRLLDYYYFDSPARKRERGDPHHGAYGLSAWGISTPAWYRANYGDDNARLLLGTMAASALLKENRWDDAMLQCLLANLRTTGMLGFRGDRIDVPELGEHGWEYYFHRHNTNFAPHYESYLWACYLWAFDKTGFGLFRDRATNAIRMTMAAYPKRWRWTNGLQQERARMLHCLAWLVRLEDTPKHRAWLRQVAEDLLALQDASGAIREEIGELGHGQMRPPQSNEAYGSGESPLLQKNGDPVCDLLYTCNFALLGLHEAAAATGDPFYSQAEDRLTRFLCRIQVRSERHPELDGAWFRAFDFRLWDYWASNADSGWGAWSIESGWTQSWITSVLAMRQMKTALWDLTADSQVARHLAKLLPQMIPEAALQPRPGETVQHAAVGKEARLLSKVSENYPGEGAVSLTDGVLAETNYTDCAWLGFPEDDLVALIDLGKSTPIGELSGSFLQNVSVGIYLPQRVDFFVGDDPSALKLAGTAMPATPPSQVGPLKETLRVKDLKLRGRYIQVHAANLKRIPAGQPAAGEKAWLFVDELMANP